MAAYSSILAKLAVKFTADTLELGKGVEKVNNSLKGIERQAASANKTLKDFAFGLGSLFVAQKVFDGFAYGIGIIANFERQMDTVRAVTGATGSEFKKLEKNALDLGAATEFGASQVAGLQIEYAKLGFSTDEILNSTKATLNLATATGSDLARATEIAGSTLRAFNLDAIEMDRVTDVMTGAFNMSALAIDSFSDGIKYVAPVAYATNVSLEETSAMLGVLADNGIKGSMAGTALRRIFTMLAKDGRPLVERLQELSEEGLTLAGANDEVGIYAQTALLVLSSQNEKVKELTSSLKDVNGMAETTSDIMRDNLTGDSKKFGAEWDSLILKGGVFTDVLRDFVNLGRTIIGGRDLENAIIGLGGELSLAEQGAEHFTEQLKKIAEANGKIIINTDQIRNLFHNISTERLIFIRKIIDEINAGLVDTKKVAKEAEADVEFFTGKLIDSFGGVKNAIDAITNAQTKVKEEKLFPNDIANINNFIELTQKQVFQQNLLNLSSDKYAAILDNLNKKKLKKIEADNQLAKANRYEWHTINEVSESLIYYGGLLNATNQANTAEIARIQGVITKLKSLKDAYEQAGIAGFNSKINTDFVKGKQASKIYSKYDSKVVNPILGSERQSVTEIPATDDFSITDDIDSENYRTFKANEAYIARFKKQGEEVEEIAINMSGIVADAFTRLGVDLGNILSGTADFGDGFLKVVADFAIKFGELMIGIGTSKLVLESSANPALIIAAGVALIALGTAVTNLEENHKAKGGSGGGGGGGGDSVVNRRGVGSSYSGGTTQNIIYSGEFRLKGSDLVAAIESANRDNYYRRGG